MAQKKRNSAKKAVSKKKSVAKKRASSAPSAKEFQSPEQSTLSGRTFRRAPGRRGRGEGSGDAGQSGDLQGLSRRAVVDSESVAELVQEGQFHEAEAVAAVEDALDPDQGELRIR